MRNAMPILHHLRDQVNLLGSVIESIVRIEWQRNDRTTRVISDVTGETVDTAWPGEGEHAERTGNLFTLNVRIDVVSGADGTGRREIIGDVRILHAGKDMIWASLDWREGVSDPSPDAAADDLEDEPMIYRQRLGSKRFEHRLHRLPWEMLSNSSGWRESYRDRVTEMITTLYEMVKDPGVQPNSSDSYPSFSLRAASEFYERVWVHEAAEEPNDGYTRRVVNISPRFPR